MTIIPLGVGVSLSSYVTACEKILTDASLKTQLHTNRTNIEGAWDEVFAAIKRCHEVVHEMGVIAELVDKRNIAKPPEPYTLGGYTSWEFFHAWV